MNNDHHEEPKNCPFSNQPCIGADCELWMEITIAKPGMVTPQKQGMCAFKAMVLVSSSPKMMMAPPQNLNLGNLGLK